MEDNFSVKKVLCKLKTHLNVHNVKGTWMSFSVHDGADTTRVTTAGDHAQVACLKLDEVHDLVRVQVQADAVVNLFFKEEKNVHCKKSGQRMAMKYK